MVLPWPPSACRPALHVGGNMPAGVISGIIGHCWCLAPRFQAMAAARLDAGRGRGCMVPWCCPGHPLPAGSEKGRCWSGERWRGGEKGGCVAGGKKVVAALETRAYSAQSCAANAALPRRPSRRLSRHPQRFVPSLYPAQPLKGWRYFSSSADHLFVHPVTAAQMRRAVREKFEGPTGGPGSSTAAKMAAGDAAKVAACASHHAEGLLGPMLLAYMASWDKQIEAQQARQDKCLQDPTYFAKHYKLIACTKYSAMPAAPPEVDEQGTRMTPRDPDECAWLMTKLEEMDADFKPYNWSAVVWDTFKSGYAGTRLSHCVPYGLRHILHDEHRHVFDMFNWVPTHWVLQHKAPNDYKQRQKQWKRHTRFRNGLVHAYLTRVWYIRHDENREAAGSGGGAQG